MSEAPPGRLRAEVSADLCVGVGICAQLAPGAFRLNRGRSSEFVPDGTWTLEELHEAADNCPMSAIRLLDASPGRDRAG